MRFVVMLATWALATLGCRGELLILHLDFNSVRLERQTIERALEVAAKAGYNAVLWEVEDKIRWKTCPECVHSEAFSKTEFQEILAKAKSLGLSPIPLLQTFGHAEYVLKVDRYRAFRELASDERCYCVSKPEVREFLRRWIREYLDLFGPDVTDFHLGGDEVRSYCTCPVCVKRNPMELYAEHLTAISGELKTKGIRPGIWCDMILADDNLKDTARIPRDFTVWHWFYGAPSGADVASWAWANRYTKLKELGFEVVFAPSSASWGDGPFLPSYDFHLKNIETAAEIVRKGNLRGLCMTSWSVRQGLKELQFPLWRYAARRLAEPKVQPVFPYGLDRATMEDLTAWDARLTCYDWRAKNGCLAPSNSLDAVFRGLKPGERAEHRTLVENLDSRISSALRRVPDESSLAEGARLSLDFLAAIRKALDGKPRGALPLSETASYLRREQTNASAVHSAKSLWSILDESGNVVK